MVADGKWISYITRRAEGTSFAFSGASLKLIAPSGGSPRTLIAGHELGGHFRFAAWGPDPGVIYVHASSASGGASFWSVPLSKGSPRLLLRLDDPARLPRRQEFATDGRRLFFTLAADESDIWVMQLKR